MVNGIFLQVILPLQDYSHNTIRNARRARMNSPFDNSILPFNHHSTTTRQKDISTGNWLTSQIENWDRVGVQPKSLQIKFAWDWNPRLSPATAPRWTWFEHFYLNSHCRTAEQYSTRTRFLAKKGTELFSYIAVKLFGSNQRKKAQSPSLWMILLISYCLWSIA